MESIYLYGSGEIRVASRGESWLMLQGKWYRFSDDFSRDLDIFLESGQAKPRLSALMRMQPDLSKGLSELAHKSFCRIRYETLLVDHPSILFLELTNQCTLRCRHCYTGSSSRQSNFLSRELAETILAEAAQLNFQTVQMTGGDPGLHPDLAVLANQALELGVPQVEVFVTAETLTPDLVRTLDNRVYFALTCFSHQAGVHDKITGVDGSWERLMAAIDLLQEENRDFRVGIVLMAENAGHYQETWKILLERGVPKEKIRGSYSSGVGRGQAYLDDTLVRGQQSLEDEPLPRSFEDSCRWRGKAAVDPAGNVYPCVFARWLKLGNVREGESLEKILSKPRVTTDQHIADVAERWEYCAKRLACADCRLLAFALMGEAR